MYSNRIENGNFLKVIDDTLLVQLLNCSTSSYDHVDAAIERLNDEQKVFTLHAVDHIINNLQTLKKEIKRDRLKPTLQAKKI